MNYFYNDGGRSASRRKKQKNDCTVRAVAIAWNLNYDYAYDFLAENGRECGRKFSLTKLFDKNPILMNRKLTKQTFPAVAGQLRMNVERFCQVYREGVYVIKMAKHVAVVKNGILYDMESCRNGQACVYSSYKIEQ